MVHGLHSRASLLVSYTVYVIGSNLLDLDPLAICYKIASK